MQLVTSAVGPEKGRAFGAGSVGMVLSGGVMGAVLAPLAFVAGAAAWRVVWIEAWYGGAVAGFLATELVYLVSGATLTVGAAFVTAVSGGPILESAVFAAMSVAFAFLLTFWIPLPVGVVSGALYEHSLTAAVVPRPASPRRRRDGTRPAAGTRARRASRPARVPLGRRAEEPPARDPRQQVRCNHAESHRDASRSTTPTRPAYN